MTTRPYDHILRPISLGDALATPAADELFVESTSNQPKITIQTTLEIDGHTLNITFNDTSISDALAILRRQARPQRSGNGRALPIRPPRKPRQRKPRYEAVWTDYDFDDAPEPDAHGAAVVATATQLLELGKAAGWSNALELARHALTTQETLQ
jgi:hypothetical protein